MIAISYRREDSLPIAGRLYDRLQVEFGKGNVFMDFDSIPYGVDFREHIKHMIDRSKVLIAIIGPDWSGKRRQRARRIDDPADFVRLEIAYALQRGIPVIPVLINDTPMPKAPDLPSDIEALAFRNAVTLHVGIDFHHHADRLVGGINRLIMEAAKSAADRKDVAPRIPPRIEKPLTPALFQDPHSVESSASTTEKPTTPLQKPHQFKLPSSVGEITPEPARKPPPLKHSKLPRETPIVRPPSLKQWWTAILRKSSWIEQTLSHRNDPVLYGAIFVLVLMLTGLLCSYFGSTRLKQWLRTPILPPVSEKRLHPAVPEPTPVQSPDDFAKYASKLREQEIAKDSFFSTTAPGMSPAPGSTVATTLGAVSAAPSSPVESSPIEQIATTTAPSVAPAQSANPSAQTIAPAARNDRTWQAWIGKFVRQFVATNQLQDVNANLAFYAPNVDYFDDHQKDHAYIRDDVEKYNERWPVRRDSIEGDIKLQEKTPDKEYAASFKLNFYAESTLRDEWSEGQFAIDLDISIIDEVPKISGIKEKVLRQQKGTTQGNASNNTVASPSPAAEAQRNSFGIIEGDYNCQFRIHPKTKHVGDKFGGRKDVAVITYGSKFVIKGTRFSHFFSLHQEPTAAGAGTWAVERYTIRADGNIFTNSPGVFILKPDRFEVVEKFPKSLADSSTSIARDHQRLPYTRWIVRYEETRMVQTSDGETWNLENKLP
jgi:hypothetical protein